MMTATQRMPVDALAFPLRAERAAKQAKNEKAAAIAVYAANASSGCRVLNATMAPIATAAEMPILSVVSTLAERRI